MSDDSVVSFLSMSPEFTSCSSRCSTDNTSDDKVGRGKHTVLLLLLLLLLVLLLPLLRVVVA